MDEKQSQATEPNGRAAYMIAWRDRYIERLQQRLAGREEENDMLSALLFYALFRQAKQQDIASGVLIPIKEIGDLLSCWSCRAEEHEGAYLVRFVPRTPQGDHAAQDG